MEITQQALDFSSDKILEESSAYSSSPGSGVYQYLIIMILISEKTCITNIHTGSNKKNVISLASFTVDYGY